MVDRSDRYPDTESANRDRRGFSGSLSGVDMITMIQFCANNRQSMVLRIRSDDASGEIYFKEGQIVHAVSEGSVGEEALQKILSLNKGSLEFEKGVRPERESIRSPWERLLLQAVAEKEKGETQAKIAKLIKSDSAKRNWSLQSIYAEASSWEEVLNCLVWSLDRNGIEWPITANRTLQRTGRVLAGLFRKTANLTIWKTEKEPLFFTVTMKKDRWIAIPHGRYLVGLETASGVDPAAVFRKLRIRLSEKGNAPRGR